MVEALETAHVADGRVGDNHAFESLRDVLGLCRSRLDHRDAHEITHRDDADELLAGAGVLDDRDVPVAVLGECRKRSARLDAGTDRVGTACHPLRDLGGRGVGARRGQVDHVAFGEDPDRAVVVVDDHNGSDPPVVHPLRGNGDGLGGLRGDNRVRHDVGDGALAGRRNGRVRHARIL